MYVSKRKRRRGAKQVANWLTGGGHQWLPVHSLIGRPPGGVLRAALLRRIPASSSHRTDLQSGPAAGAPAAVVVVAGPGSGGGVPDVSPGERRPRGLSPRSTLPEFGRVYGSCRARTTGKRDNGVFLLVENETF